MSDVALDWDGEHEIWQLSIRGRRVLSLRTETVHQLKQEIDAKMRFKYTDADGNEIPEDVARELFAREGRPAESEAAKRWREMTRDIDQL